MWKECRMTEVMGAARVHEHGWEPLTEAQEALLWLRTHRSRAFPRRGQVEIHL